VLDPVCASKETLPSQRTSAGGAVSVGDDPAPCTSTVGTCVCPTGVGAVTGPLLPPPPHEALISAAVVRIVRATFCISGCQSRHFRFDRRSWAASYTHCHPADQQFPSPWSYTTNRQASTTRNTANRRDSPRFQRHCSLLGPFLRCRRRRTASGDHPVGTGSVQMRSSIAPNRRRVRCPSANRSQ
jgi:hypothetical protein